jgi:transcriptional regulator GlxA family with amidase domain
MGYTYGLFIYENAACFDFTGPLDVFNISNIIVKEGRVLTIAQDKGKVRCSGGLEVLPKHSIADAPPLDILLVPGSENPTLGLSEDHPAVRWIGQQADKVKFMTSVCTGAVILQLAGLLANHKATTHWMYAEQLAADKSIKMMPEMRYVRDGNIVTSQGVSAGIDMALWLVGQLHSPEHARMVRKVMHYDPAPPYTAEV